MRAAARPPTRNTALSPGPSGQEARAAADETGPGAGLILLSKVTKRFPKMSTPALDGVNLAIPRGSFFTIVGPSGVGKSTLLRVLAGLTKPDSGRVSVFGEPPAEASRRKHLGWVPQSPALLPWRSVLDNVKLPLQLNRRAKCQPRDPEHILALLGLSDAMDRLPAQLSGGMRQRVAIARAFAFAPAVLLMDEPFGALDEITREHVAHLLLDLWQAERPTVVFVTHSVTEAVVLSDQVSVMRQGKLGQPVDIALPRPRPEGIEDGEAFHELERELRARLREAFAATAN